MLIGMHRIDTVMKWSELIGIEGKLILVEAVPRYLDNIKNNLENHLNWNINNIDHISMTISGLELDALKGMRRIHGLKILFDPCMPRMACRYTQR